jgi:ATP-dependent DNA ligase
MTLPYRLELRREQTCRLGAEGIVSKRVGSRYRPRPQRCGDWIKVKNPAAPAVRREQEEEWGGAGRRT